MSREMKDSGVEWIEEIPKEWSVKKLKNVASVNDATLSSNTKRDYTFFYIDIGSVSLSNGIEKLEQLSFSEAPSRARRIVKNGDIIVSTVRTYLKAIALVKDAENLIVSTGFAVVRPRRIYSGYLAYFVKSDLFTERVNQLSTGIAYPSINSENLMNIKIFVPPKETQYKITKFLDKKTSKIDKLIEQTKQSIEELKAYKQSLITETVTKGLNPDVPMSDSKVNWIREFPSHWKVQRIKNIFKINKNIANSNQYNVLSVTQKGLKVKDIESNEGQMAKDYSHYQLVTPNDFVMNHMDLLTGWIDLSNELGVTSPDYRVFNIKDETWIMNKINLEYYKYVFQMGYKNKLFYGLGQGVSKLGRWRLPVKNFYDFKFPTPPINEQNEIVEFLDNRTQQIDNLITKKQQMLEELESYKQSLIYEYVTGKKEVK